MHTLTPQITAAQALAALQKEARRHQLDPTHPTLEPIFQARAEQLAEASASSIAMIRSLDPNLPQAEELTPEELAAFTERCREALQAIGETMTSIGPEQLAELEKLAEEAVEALEDDDEETSPAELIATMEHLAGKLEPGAWIDEAPMHPAITRLHTGAGPLQMPRSGAYSLSLTHSPSPKQIDGLRRRILFSFPILGDHPHHIDPIVDALVLKGHHRWRSYQMKARPNPSDPNDWIFVAVDVSTTDQPAPAAQLAELERTPGAAEALQGGQRLISASTKPIPPHVLEKAAAQLAAGKPVILISHEDAARHALETLEATPGPYLAPYGRRLHLLKLFADSYQPRAIGDGEPTGEAPPVKLAYQAGVDSIKLETAIRHLKIWRIHGGAPRIEFMQAGDLADLALYSCEFQNVRSCEACNKPKAPNAQDQERIAQLERLEYEARQALADRDETLELVERILGEAANLTGDGSSTGARILDCLDLIRRPQAKHSYQRRIAGELTARDNFVDEMQAMIARAVEILAGALADMEHETPEQTANQIAAALQALGATRPDEGSA